ncbi:uncharacterized protein LOC114439088 isoform X1 [Parambassis ranga]|uniref:Uncharacterized protein LOC114439088 isoform X1 n=1 Tax=Parambassis ranga TaxID=210632 RepID=A0A6P7IST5_9TELE|nr:uncharacterized protein LOC114439088 isoform X1 [Parambassis ranga]
MFLAGAGCIFVGFILCVSGVHGEQNSICALKGSSVNLTCSAQHPTSNKKWYIRYSGGSETELSAHGSHVKYRVSEEDHFTLTVNDLRENDTHTYCCKGPTSTSDTCQQRGIHLRVTDLQLKVFPTTEGQTVTLMCSTSCPLTEKPAAYIWYKNREFLYEDWSPWYQELVSSEEAVRYSCAIKGYEDLRAPAVSVDSVTATCFSVTYAKGTMCSYKHTSVDESCSITHPTETHVQRTPPDTSGHVRLTCNTSCVMTDPLTSVTWYKNRQIQRTEEKKQLLVPITSADSFSCTVKGHEYLHSADICAEEKNCWSVNHVSRRVCALKGFSVNISAQYSHPDYQQPESKFWCKVKRNSEEESEQLSEEAHNVTYYDNTKNKHILMFKYLKQTDSAEYIFRIKAEDGIKQSYSPGVTLFVTDLKVQITPSAVVTEGQTVRLTCSTSCPLTDTAYIWYFNSRPLNLSHSQNKHLLLDPVSSQHAGRYYCSVRKGTKSIRANEKTLTVQSITGKWEAAAAGVSAALLALILVMVFLWIRKKKLSRQAPTNTTFDNLEQYDVIAAQPAEEELHYSDVHFSKNNPDPLYSVLQNKEQVPYAEVNFRTNTTPE